MIPPIWFLEIDRINAKLGRVPINQTEGDELKIMLEKGLISKATLNDITVCFLLFLASRLVVRTKKIRHVHLSLDYLLTRPIS
jgi:hypothetical protein